MKILKLSLVIILTFLVTIGLSGVGYAFHDGGVAYCDGCHTMHNSLAGVSMRKGGTEFVGVNWLLLGSDQSSTCLNCHGTTSPTPSSFHVMTTGLTTTPGTPPLQYTPGGDFGWLSKNYAAIPASFGIASPGYLHGHNINAADYSLPAANEVLTQAPGGTYLQANFYCTSCHNPHSSARIICNPVTPTCIVNSAIGSNVLPISGSGSYAGGWPPPAGTALGVYRLLGSIGYVPFSYTGGPAFVNYAPLATAPSSYNRVETATDTRVAYGTISNQWGMSEWCANCHPQIYNGNATGLTAPHIHPTGVNALLTATANISGTSTTYQAIYNAYVASGNLTGTLATSYWSLVPYEETDDDLTILSSHTSSSGGYTVGPTVGNEHVSCLTCHRAHASGFNEGTRWNNNAEFEVVAGLWPDWVTAASENYSNGMPQTDYLAAMYQRSASTYAVYQRSFCNKCHAKD